MSKSAPTVFISYAHQDEAWKDRLVEQLRVLELEGDFDVWDDREIAAGDVRQQRIEEAIDRARIAVLLISASYLTSDPIRDRQLPRILARRASGGLRMIPLIVRACNWQAVDGLRRVQVCPRDARALSAGSKHQIDANLSGLAMLIRDLLGGPPEPRGPAEPPAEHAATRPPEPSAEKLPPKPAEAVRRWPSLAVWLLLPALAAVLLALAASSWRRPTRVEVELTTRRLVFTVGGMEPRKVLNVSVPFSSLVIEGCDSLAFAPAELAVMDAAQPDAEGSWHRLALVDRVVRLACRDPDAKLALRSPEPTLDRALGTFDRIWVAAGSQVILEVSPGHEVDGDREIELTADLDLARSLRLTTHGELEIDAEFAELEEVAEPAVTGDVLSYRARLEEPDRWLELRSRRGLTLIVVPPAGATDDLFISTPIPVENVELLVEDLDGEMKSALLSEAQLSYPRFPALPAVTVPLGDFLGIGELGTAQLKRLVLDADTPGLRLAFDGVAGNARSTDGAFVTDYRLTVWDRFTHSSLWNRLAVVAIWALSTVLLALERWKTLSENGR